MISLQADPGQLRTAFEPVSALVDECKVQFSPEAVSIRAVDPANVGMVDLTINADEFTEYEADSHLLGLNLSRFQNILNQLSSESETPARIELDEETRKLHLAKDGLEFTLALIDPDSIRAEPDIPDLDLPGEVELSGSHFNRALTAADMVSKYIELGIEESPSIFYAAAEGDTDDVSYELSEDELERIESGDAESVYSLEYLSEMGKNVPDSELVTLELGEEFPIMISFEMDEGGADVLYVLAPRIQSD